MGYVFGSGEAELRVYWILPICAILGGCGLARQKEAQERYQTIISEVTLWVEDCRKRFPEGQKTALARSQCIGKATEGLKGISPYPDLIDQENANRDVLAEKWQKGQMTEVEYRAQFAQMHSQMEAERQRRQMLNRSVSAQESAAAAAWQASSPVTCTKLGNSTTCY